MDYFVTQKMAWNDTTKLPMKFLVAITGRKPGADLFPHDYANDIDPVQIAKDVARRAN